MEADAQVSQLEQALIQQAETLAREALQNAESARARILADSAEKLKLAEAREVLAAKVGAERLVQRHSQAAETRLAAELDRLRWALTEATLAGVKTAFQKLAQDETRYLEVLEAWLAAAAQALPPGDLVAEVRPEDEKRLAPRWAEIAARAAPGRAVTLASHSQSQRRRHSGASRQQPRATRPDLRGAAGTSGRRTGAGGDGTPVCQCARSGHPDSRIRTLQWAGSWKSTARWSNSNCRRRSSASR